MIFLGNVWEGIFLLSVGGVVTSIDNIMRPKLVGNDAGYLAGRLEQYRAGEKVGPNSALMMPAASDLSDADIAALAEYITTAFD